MLRRDLFLSFATACGALSATAKAGSPGPNAAPQTFPNLTARCRALEQAIGGRLGVAVIDAGSGAVFGYRADERFPLCSSFKWLLAAAVLARVDAGEERLDRRFRIQAADILDYAPITQAQVANAAGMSIANLCEAAVADSDNTAANLLMQSIGGIPAFNRFVRRNLGDTTTRLDRGEPELNESIPGDPRDTTTPLAMAMNLRLALLPVVAPPNLGLIKVDLQPPPLTDPSREQLVRWMLATRTSGKRLRAGLPAGWRLADKTGTGNSGTGTANDVGVYWPPGDMAPVVVAVYLTGAHVNRARQELAIAEVGGWVREMQHH